MFDFSNLIKPKNSTGVLSADFKTKRRQFIMDLYGGSEELKGYTLTCYKTSKPYPIKKDGELQYTKDGKVIERDWFQDREFVSKVSDLEQTIEKHIGINQYVPINLFRVPTMGGKDDGRKAVNVSWICDFFFDIDIHDTDDQEDRERQIQDTIEKLNKLFEDGIIPKWTYMIHSGRGIALHYMIQPIEVLTAPNKSDIDKYIAYESNKRLVAHYKEAYERIFGILYDEFGELADHKVASDLARVCRLPYTKNTKAGTFSYVIERTGIRYTLDEIWDKFGLDNRDSRAFLQAEAASKKSAKEEKSGNFDYIDGVRSEGAESSEAHADTSSIKLLKAVKENHTQRTPNFKGLDGTTINLQHFKITKDALNSQIKFIQDIVSIREGKLTGSREVLLFVYYNICRSLYPADASEDMTKDLNDLFSHPLDYSEINNMMYYVELHIERDREPYRFHNETVMEKLDVTDDEVRQTGFGQAKTKRLIGHQKKLTRDARNIRIIELAFEKIKYKDIIEKLVEEGFERISVDTVKDVVSKVKKQGLSPKKDSIDAVNKDKLSSYYRAEDDVDFIKGTSDKVLEMKEPTQEEMLAILRTGKDVLIKGVGGGGKTTIIKAYLEELGEAGVMKLAQNGMPALDIGGKTIHSAFGLPLGVLDPDEEYPIPEGIEDKTVFIIDEIGQVRMDLFTVMMQMINQIRKTHPVQVILAGDFCQAMPVAKKKDRDELKSLYKTFKAGYAYESPLWNKKIKTINLTKNKRSQDEDMTLHQERLRLGVMMKSTMDWFNDNLDHTENENVPYIVPTKKLAKKINEKHIAEFNNRTVMTADYSLNWGTTFYEDLPAPYQLELAVGMRVKTVINRDNYRNGSLGTIVRINKDSIRIKFDNGVSDTIEKHTFIMENGTFTQYPITYAYAFTANAAQGMTLEEYNVITGFFAPGQLYTALSRGRRREKIHLLGQIEMKEMVKNYNRSAIKFSLAG